jgi:hypothetical protein
MKFFSLSLRRRLLLAIIPSFVLLLVLVTDELIKDWYLRDGDQFLMSIAYAALFGVLVMAPFITSPSRLILRIGLLIAASILIPFAAILSDTWFKEIGYDASLGIAGILAAIFVILSALLLAAVLIIAAPLKVSRQYWFYVVLAAIVTTAVAFGSMYWFFCIPLVIIWLISDCPWWSASWWSDLAVIIPPSVVGPLSFCTAVYFGRIDSKRVDQIATESGRE